MKIKNERKIEKNKREIRKKGKEGDRERQLENRKLT